MVDPGYFTDLLYRPLQMLPCLRQILLGLILGHDVGQPHLRADAVGLVLLGREGSQRTFREIGIPDAHHPITHHKGDAALIAKVQKINRYHVELFSRFVAKLAATQDGDGTLLDHMMILYGAGMSDPNQHNPADLPTMMVGGANGRIKGGRHVNVPANTPVTNLYMSMLDIMGVSADHFGDSTGKLEGLTELS